MYLAEHLGVAEKPDWIPGLGEEMVMAALAEAEQEAEAAGQALFGHALTSIARTAGITSLVLGAKRPAQVEEAIATLDR